MLTFVTPTLLAGDRSLVSVIVHEIVHRYVGGSEAQAEVGSLWLTHARPGLFTIAGPAIS